MIRRYMLATVLGLMAVSGMPAPAQPFAPESAAAPAAPAQSPTPTPTPPYPPQGDDSTSSLGSFNVQVLPQFVPLFYYPGPPAPLSCPGFDSATGVLSSPPLSDPATDIGRSNEVPDGMGPSSPPYPCGPPSELTGVPVGIAGTVVNEFMLVRPPGFPCVGVANCTFGPGTADVLTEVHSLHMTGSGAAVRAGTWYNNGPNGTVLFPPRISPGKVESQSGPAGTALTFFPASSFFDVYAQVDIPACVNSAGAPLFPGAFTATTLYNTMPLVVKNNQVTSFPPKVVYLHDSSSAVPILFATTDTAANPPRWHADDILGYFVLVGHGIGFGTGQSDQNQFNTLMGKQSNAACPYSSPSGSSSIRTNSPPTASSAGKTEKPVPGSESKPASGSGNRSSGGGGS